MDQSERFVQKMNDGAANASDEGGGVSVPNESVSFTNNDPVPVKKKKNKKKRKPSKKAPSGFEEYYVEPPLTKEEYEEDLAKYSIEKSFVERIEQAIQAYRSRRKFDETRSTFFDNYLRLGGISSNPKQWGGGLDKVDAELLDADQIQKLTARDFVPDAIRRNFGADADDEEDEYWEVDFALVVKAFLSYKVPFYLGYNDVAELTTACKLVRNFLNYLLYHNVCAEYAENIKDAIAVTFQADNELAQCKYFGKKSPNRFNTACSTYFGGRYHGLNDDLSWMDPNIKLSKVGYTKKEAIEILDMVFKNDIFPESYREVGLKAKRVAHETVGVEVIGIEMPPPNAPGSLLAIGKLKLKVWNADEDNKWETDLDEFEIFIEKDSLRLAFEGMHFEATFHTLDTGMMYMDNMTACQTSFFVQFEDPDFGDSSTFSSDAEDV